MGYYMDQVDQDFSMKSGNMEAALTALRQWEIRECEEYGGHFSPDDATLSKAANLVDALRELDWEAELDDQGNIVALNFIGDRIANEEEWFPAIAPYVEKGSTIEMVGEDHECWCWYFDGETCVDYNGEVIYPGMPE